MTVRHPQPTIGEGNEGDEGCGSRKLSALPPIRSSAPYVASHDTSARPADPFDHPEWVFDVKYDGFGAVAYIEQRRSRLISRNNNNMTRFNVLAEQVAATLEFHSPARRSGI